MSEASDYVVVGFEPSGHLVYQDEDDPDGQKWTDSLRLAEYGVGNLTDVEIATLLAHPLLREEDRELLEVERRVRVDPQSGRDPVRALINGSTDEGPAQCIDPSCRVEEYHDHPEDA